jgi:hypothetical protein
MEKRSAPRLSLGSLVTVAQREWGGERSLQGAGSSAATLILALLLIVAPLPYGAVLPGGHVLVQTLAFGAAALALFFRPEGRGLGASTVPVIALAALAFVGVVQLIPLPEPMLERIAPASARAYENANEVLGIFNRSSLSPRVSIAPASTLTAVLLTLAYAAAFAASAIAARSEDSRRSCSD